MLKSSEYLELLPFATDAQKDYVHAINECPTHALAAQALGINKKTITKGLKRLKTNAEKSGFLYSKEYSSDKIRTHAILPDVQAKHGTPTDHLRWVGRYLAEYQPDVIVNIGDFADMPSLSSYDRGKKSFEGRRYNLDILAAREAMQVLLEPIKTKNETSRKKYNPEMHLTLGNHEDRINRAVDLDPILEDTMGVSNLKYEDDWIVHQYLKPVCIDGVTYAHYFYHPNTGKPYGGTSMNATIKTIGFSFTMGHQQGKMIGSRELSNGKVLRGLVVGSCYLHDEEYKGYQGNEHWRGIIIKHEVNDGNYDLMEVSLDFLCRKYEQTRLKTYMKEKYGDEHARLRN